MKDQTLIKKSGIETELLRYDDLNRQIKTLEAQKELLRKALIKSYFENKSVYESKILIATYMPQDRNLFDNKHFKDEYPKLYDEFTYKQTVYILCVKTLNAEIDHE